MINISQMKDSYEKHKNLKVAADEIGMGWQNLYYHLKRNGIEVVGDKSKYGSDSDKLAYKAEQYFQKIVPFASNNNNSKFQSKVDFMVGDLKVDVKSSKLNLASNSFKSKRWAFSLKKQELIADFFVCIGYEDEDVTIFLFPSEIIKNYQTISINPYGKSKWHQYEINEFDLLDFFTKMANY